MFGISFSEIAFVCVIVLLVFGPEKLPEIAKTFGNFMGMIKKNTDEVRKDFYNSVYTPLDDVQGKLKLHERKLRAIGKEILEDSSEDKEIKKELKSKEAADE